MDILNRSVAILRPKQAYLDWIHTLPGPYYETLEDLRKQSRAILIPESSSSESAIDTLRDSAGQLFEMELEAWMPGKLGWPENRDFDTLIEWFDIEIQLLVIDSVSSEIQIEPYGR